MKTLLTLFIAFIMFIAVSCKKDNPSALGSITGDYTIYELEIYNPPGTYPFPTSNGDHGKIVIQASNDTTGTARVLLYDKNNKSALDTTFNCKIGKDQDGDYFMTNKRDNRLAAYIYDGNDMDFFALPNGRFSAKK